MQLPNIDGKTNPAFVSFPHFLYAKDPKIKAVIIMQYSVAQNFKNSLKMLKFLSFER